MRRSRHATEYNFWPSFVDALSTLLIVVLFFLLLFVLAHFFMGRNLDTKNTEINKLNEDLQLLTSELSAQRKTTEELSAERSQALAQMALLEQDLKALTLRKEELEKEAAEKGSALEAERKISEKTKAHIAVLTAETEKLTKELARLGSLLSEAEAKDKEKQAQITDLGKKLNRALAAKTSELSAYRSEFFGTLRQILKDRDDIRIEGDRFVFQSELFFKSGSAFLEEKGKKQLNILAKTIKELQKKIPSNISWVLRVDGHTDNIPIHNELYSSNWQLSANRAIAVVQYLIDQGVPARYLVAAGFGEHQPIDRKNTEKARRKNRRIEFKLTER